MRATPAPTQCRQSFLDSHWTIFSSEPSDWVLTTHQPLHYGSRVGMQTERSSKFLVWNFWQFWNFPDPEDSLLNFTQITPSMYNFYTRSLQFLDTYTKQLNQSMWRKGEFSILMVRLGMCYFMYLKV